MDGRELIRELLKARPGLPIVLCTGFNENPPEGAALCADGLSALLMKPFSVYDLSRAVRTALDAQAAGGSPAAVSIPRRLFPKTLAASALME